MTTGDIIQKNIMAFAFIDLTPVTFENVSSEKYEKKPCLVSNYAFIFQMQLLGNLLFPLSPSSLAARLMVRSPRQREGRARLGNTRFSLVITLNTLL